MWGEGGAVVCFGSSIYNGLCAPIWINSHMKDLFIIIIITEGRVSDTSCLYGEEKEKHIKQNQHGAWKRNPDYKKTA